MKAHPIADLFPMMAADELKDLAADIGERGLLQDIVLDNEGRILDGRNRHAACELVGVEPTFTSYDGDDPDGYVLSANIARRHMTKGQQAMIIAQVCLVSKQTVREAAGRHGVSAAYIAKANTVIEHAHEWVDSVISGAYSLDDAYDLAKDRKEKAAEAERLLAQLHDCAPNLADQVVEGKLTIHEAFKRWRDRQAKSEQTDRQRKQVATDRLCDHVWTVAAWCGGRAVHLAQDFDPKLASGGRPVTMQTLLDAQTVIEAMIGVFKERGLP